MHPSKVRGGWLLVLGVYWVLQIVYFLSPIDIIPDFVPIFGFADDLVGLLAGMGVTAYTLYREYGAPALPEPDAYRPLSVHELDDL